MANTDTILTRATRMASDIFGRRTAKARLQATRTSRYSPVHHSWGVHQKDLPAFTHRTVQAMLLDPAVRLGVAMRAAPIYGVEIAHKEAGKWVPGVVADGDDVRRFVERQLSHIWNHIEHLLTAQVWGWSAGEITYRLTRDNLVEVDRLLPRHAADTRALLRDGELCGTHVLRIAGIGHVDLEFPKTWFHAYQPDAGRYYGHPATLGAYSPWWSKWMNGGAMDVRELFMHKDAYGGTDITYPEGMTMISDTETIPNRDIARQLVEQLAAGGVTARPAAYDSSGNELWQLTRATVPSSPTHILEYPKDLDVEIWRGLEIPDGVMTSDDTGAWAGKRVPLATFYAGLDRWLITIIRDIKTQILEPLVELNYGEGRDFEITHKPLPEQAMEQQGDAGGQQPPTGSGPPQSGPQPGGFPPHRMSLDPVQAVGEGVLSAAELVKAARRVIRMAGQHTPESLQEIVDSGGLVRTPETGVGHA
jgi:hypothetical protein